MVGLNGRRWEDLRPAHRGRGYDVGGGRSLSSRLFGTTRVVVDDEGREVLVKFRRRRGRLERRIDSGRVLLVGEYGELLVDS
jgi:hypothetical protein